jgi:dihydroxy-acid dehydratase
MISIDIPEKTITLNVEDAVIQDRLSAWKPPEPKITSGYLARYSRNVSSASTGAVVE